MALNMIGNLRQVALLAVMAAVGGAAVLGYRSMAPANLEHSAQIASGRSLYAQHCASCHGAKLEGQPNWQEPLPNGHLPAPPHDATGHTWHHSDAELFAITRNGLAAVVPGYQSDMPAFAGVLSDEEILAVLAFIRNTWPEKEREYQAVRSKAEKQ